MKRTKVLIAINCLNIGGAPSVVLAHVRGLDTRRFEPWVLTLYKSKPANFITPIQAEISPEHMHECRLRNRSLLDLRTWWEIYAFLRKEQFDVVITHLFLANTIVRTLAVLARVPRIIAYEHSRYTNKRLWQIFVDTILALSTYRIVVATKEIQEFTARQEGIALQKFAVIPNPLLLKTHTKEEIDSARAAWGIQEGVPLFVSVGRFSEEKGHRYLLDAVSILQKDDVPFRLLIIGHGAQAEALHSQRRELGVENLVSIIEEPERASLAYALGDVFVLPSLREGESLATREALMSGLPVIASDLPTLYHLVADAGILVPPADGTALAEAIRVLRDDAELRARYAIVARTRVTEGSTHTSLRALESILV